MRLRRYREIPEPKENDGRPRWRSAGERECRQRLEALKGEYYRSALNVAHPCSGVRDENLAIARANIRRHDWATRLYDGMASLADHYADRTGVRIDAMVPDLTPLHVYGTFCPVCEADNTYRMRWDYRDPERLVCFHCGAVMTDQSFAEFGRLELPRSGQSLTYYIRPEEQGDPAFSAGGIDFSWAGWTRRRGRGSSPVLCSVYATAKQVSFRRPSSLAKVLTITAAPRWPWTAADVCTRLSARTVACFSTDGRLVEAHRRFCLSRLLEWKKILLLLPVSGRGLGG